MCDRKVLIFLRDLMYKLWSGILSGLDWLFRVLCMFQWLVLRHHRTNSCHRSLRCGIILFILSVHMLELSRWNLRCLVFDYKLFELSGDHFPSFDWLHYMLGLYCWFILRHHRIDSRDRSMCCGILLVVFSVGVLKLSSWSICFIVFIDKLLKLSGRNLHCISIKFKLHELLCRYISSFHRLK